MTGLVGGMSADHAALIGLMSCALGKAEDSILIKAASQASSENVAGLATSNLVHTYLQSGLQAAPGIRSILDYDFEVYASEMKIAGSHRNKLILQQISHLSQVLEGMGGVLLKGAAEISNFCNETIGPRFLSDIDILIAADVVEDVKSCLIKCGYYFEPSTDFRDDNRHQLAACHHPDFPVPVEIHTIPGGGRVGEFLTAKQVMSNAVNLPNSSFSIPSEKHMAILAVLHAMFSNDQVSTFEFLLRDVVNFSLIKRRFRDGDIWSRSDGNAELERCISSMISLAEAIEGRVLPKDPWARKALLTFSRPNMRRLIYLQQTSKTYLSLLRRPGAYSELFAFLGSKRRFGSAISYHLKQLRKRR